MSENSIPFEMSAVGHQLTVDHLQAAYDELMIIQRQTERVSVAARAKFGLDDSWGVIEVKPSGVRWYRVKLHNPEHSAFYYGRLSLEDIESANPRKELT